MLVVADSSALIAVATCDGLNWLDHLFTKVQVPQTVYAEATAKGKPQASALKNYLAGKVIDVDLSEFVIVTTKLGKGELEAMALYKHQHADRLLIDDLQARKAASYNGIKVIGSVGILLLAKENGLIPSIRPYLDAIQHSCIYINQGLINEALKIACEAEQGEQG